MYTVMSATHRLIRHQPGPAELFERVCSLCVASGQARLAVIEVLDGGVAYRASARWRDGDAPMLLTEPDDSGPVMFNPLTSPDADKACISNDTFQDPRLRLWSAWCLHNDVHAMAAIPIQRDGVRVGALLIYASQAEVFQDDTVAQLKEMCAALSVALDDRCRTSSRLLPA